MDERLSGARFLLRGRDAKVSGPFDEVFRIEGVRVIRTPIRAPRANAFAERFVRTVRRERLDHILIYGRRHLERVLQTHVAHYLEERPHQGLSLEVPAGIRTPLVRGAPRTPVERGRARVRVRYLYPTSAPVLCHGPRPGSGTSARERQRERESDLPSRYLPGRASDPLRMGGRTCSLKSTYSPLPRREADRMFFMNDSDAICTEGLVIRTHVR
jgi:hypothetical protein